MTDAFQADLDTICYNLSPSSWLNPHRSWLGLGNYDVNVLTAALHTRDCDLVWFDKRKRPETIVTDNVIGFILNVPNDLRLGWLQLPLRRKHWVALKELRGAQHSGFYNLDSKLKRPERIGERPQFVEYLKKELKSSEKELFLVVCKEVLESSSWKEEDSL